DDRLTKMPADAECVANEHVRIETWTARINTPASVDSDGLAPDSLPLGVRLITIAESRIAAAEISVALAQRRMSQKIGNGDRIDGEQGIPQRLRLAESRHRLCIAQMRMHIHESDFAAEKGCRFSPFKYCFRASVIGDRLVRQTRAIRKE